MNNSGNSFFDKLKSFFADLPANAAETWEALKVDLKVFFGNLSSKGTKNSGESYPRIWVENDRRNEPRGPETVRNSGAPEPRPKIHIDETVRSQYVPGRGHETVRSQTNSRYDKDYKKPKKESPKWWKVTKGFLSFILRAVATLLLICIMTGCIVGAAAMVYVLAFLDKDIDFDLYNLKMKENTSIYYENESGTDVVYQVLHGQENREWVDYDKIPQYTKNAFVGIEDHRFWTHSGVDWRRTIFAFGNMFLHMSDSQQGGSTITQQLIKNVTEENEVSIERKLKEIFRALDLERQYSKDTILESYLNVIALGNGCNGVQAAAKTYFDKDVSKLTLAESCCIAGITKNPSKYNPLYYPENNKTRAKQTLSEMLKYSFITQEEYDSAYKEIEAMTYNEKARYNPETKSYNNWYVDQIIYDLIDDLQTKNGMSATEAKWTIYNGGLQIYSCMDLNLQKKIDSLFADAKNFKKFPNKKAQPQAAIVVMNYKGEIKALSGGRGTKSQDLVLNRATQSQRQPGSAIKPLAVYGPAVELGLLEYSTPVTDEPSLVVNGKKWPKNSGGKCRGNIPVIKGLEVSANCVAVRISTVIGYEKAFNFMTERLGLKLVSSRVVGKTTFSDKNPSTCLGALTDGVTVREMTAAYATFGNGGKLYPPVTYSKVLDSDGNAIIDNTKVVPTQAFSKETATIMNRMLRAPINGSNGTGKTAKFGGYKIFGKTGTTSDNKDRYFAGGTPYYVAACWFGYDLPKKLELTSTNYALTTWKMVMQAAHKGLSSKKDFDSFSSKVVAMKYCTVTGGLAGAGCSSTGTGYYVKKTKMPTCPIHSGGKATDAFNRFLANKSSFSGGGGDDEDDTDGSSESTTSTTKSSTTVPPVVSSDKTKKTTASTTESSKTTDESTTKSTKSTKSTTKSTESTTESTTKSTTESTTKSTTESTTKKPPEENPPEENPGNE